jgi:acyl-CoA reductase-like NAD-dependent aldehyde dehydrogenase
VAPTLISALPPETAVEEIFGPVAFVHQFSKEEEAIRITNMAPGMLLATIFTKDKSR